MTNRLGRLPPAAYAILVTISGCGGSQPAVGAPGPMPKAKAVAMHAARSKSWMLPEARNENLLYVSTLRNGVDVLTYPEGKLVGQLDTGQANGVCSDGKGDVFIVQFQAQDILEYSHGSTKPKSLNDSGNAPLGCAVDPTTGNLAVVGGDGPAPENVALFTNAGGSPTVYTHGTGSFMWGAYDDQGNLFITTGATYEGTLFELPRGSGTFTEISVNKAFGDNASLQWDGKSLALEDAPECCPRREGSPATLYQVQISGSTGTVVDTITLDKATNKSKTYDYGVQFWIQGDGTLIAPKAGDHGVGLWRYPSGGLPVRSIAVGGPITRIYGVTVSLAAK